MAQRATGPDELVAKKATNSAIWKHFGFQPNEEGEPENPDFAVCKICMREVKARGGNTSNLTTHLQKHHPAAYGKLMKNRVVYTSKAKKIAQESIANAFARVQPEVP